MEFKEFAKEFPRMCKSNSCAECVMSGNDAKYVGDGCLGWTIDHPDEAEEIISAWAKEHPVRTYLTDFKEKFPKSTYFDSAIYCSVCRKRLYGQIKSSDKCLCDDCEECWNQEVKK